MSVEDPRLVVWAREQAQALGQISTEKRVRIIERTIGVSAKQVREDVSAAIATVQADVDAVQAAALAIVGHTNARATFGTAYLTWNGSASTIGDDVFHGLGRTPTAVVATPQSQSGTGPVSVHLFSPPGSTSFTLYGCTVPVGSSAGYVPPAGTSIPVGWIAIG